jgi:hypothetical protein
MNAVDDYYVFLDDMNMSAEFVRMASETPHKDIEVDGVEVKPSEIEGVGLFATKEFKQGEKIMQATINGMRTQAGRFTNHHPEPNAEPVLSGGDFHLIAKRDISNEEITTSYRQTNELMKVARVEISKAEASLLALPQINPPIRHFFGDGVYGREMTLRAGEAITGAVHLTNHINVLVQGTMFIRTTLSEAERITAPHVSECPKNTKKVMQAITDCVYINFIGTDLKDVEEIERTVVATDYIERSE